MIPHADGLVTVMQTAWSLGLAVGGGHLLSATRHWVREMEVPPTELARIKWNQARAAVSAGAVAWQNGPQANPADAA